MPTLARRGPTRHDRTRPDAVGDTIARIVGKSGNTKLAQPVVNLDY